MNQPKRKMEDTDSESIGFQPKVRALDADEESEDENSWGESSFCLVCDTGSQPASSRHFFYPSLKSRVDHARFHMDISGRDYWETYKECFVLSKSAQSSTGQVSRTDEEKYFSSDMEGDDEYSETEVEEFSREFASRNSLLDSCSSDHLEIRGSHITHSSGSCDQFVAHTELADLMCESEEEDLFAEDLDSSGSVDFFGDSEEDALMELIDQSSKHSIRLESGFGYIEDDYMGSELECDGEVSFAEDYSNLMPAMSEDGTPKIVELESSELEESEGKAGVQNVLEIGTMGSSVGEEQGNSRMSLTNSTKAQVGHRDDSSEEEI